MATAPVASQEPRIVLAVAEQAVAALQDEAIVRAKATVTALRGVVITNQAEASRVADQLGIVKDGQRVAKALLEGLTSPLRKAIDRARFTFAPVTDLLSEAEKSGKAATAAWNAEQERRRIQERDRLAKEAREAQAKQATNGVVAPPMEAPPQEIARSPRGRRTSTFETSIVCVELVDPTAVAAFDPSLLKLDETRAKQVYRELEGTALSPHPLGGFVVHGMRFWRDKRIGVR